MKTFLQTILTSFLVYLLIGCGQTNTDNKAAETPVDTLVSVPDTGFTGIRQYYSKEKLVKEVTFDNGIREGLMKTFYSDGRLRQTFMYRNGMREDTAKWYYTDGFVFRETLYKNDTMHGEQTQFYTTGKVKAKMSYIEGARTPELLEYAANGKLISSYPELITNVKDEYSTTGLYKINLELSQKTTKVNFYRGEFSNGVFDTLQLEKIPIRAGMGYLELKKSDKTNNGTVGVIASFITAYGNRKFIYKSIELPYRDLD